MKKILSVLALGSVMMVGCVDRTTVNVVPVGEERFNGIDAQYINIITDSETGCKYIFVDDGQGNYRTTAMSPLYKSSGVMDCD
ncbi:DUF6440 family protein [Bacillus sp. NTK034]|uniref:DUF6440 family protein n=1 Tax=Bacillus sp. NTK034 TaxID=2802176 RepID=UPI001A8F4481|nr:DUF6440 family protein [Bacillus sp. NTK034]MBN8200513.1 hypothetical protein [Bacillus sp. NTK034]